eukprot:scaffold236872_cov33-Tisochrysis_lutea.AAC.4
MRSTFQYGLGGSQIVPTLRSIMRALLLARTWTPDWRKRTVSPMHTPNSVHSEDKGGARGDNQRRVAGAWWTTPRSRSTTTRSGTAAARADTEAADDAP